MMARVPTNLHFLIIILLFSYYWASSLALIISQEDDESAAWSSSSINFVNDDELRVIKGPGVILHKTSGPLEPVGRPLGDDFPGAIPAQFIRQAYGIDAPHSTGGRKIILNQTTNFTGERVCTTTTSESAATAEGATTNCCKNDEDGGDSDDNDVIFGMALFARAREMFVNRGLEHELESFLATRVSNPNLGGNNDNGIGGGGRRMHWVGIDILPNQSLALHSHPNIEFAYIVQGIMHEWRLMDYTTIPKKKIYVPEEITTAVHGTTTTQTILKYHGPNMTDLDAGKQGTFQHNMYSEGEMFINTIGDVHQSFTKDEGVKLFVMWGDGNADVPNDQYPKNAHFLNKQSAKAWE